MGREQNPVMNEGLRGAAQSIRELRDAVRELKDAMPDSVLARLAEQKIDRIERDQSRDRGPGLSDVRGADAGRR